MRHLVGHHAQPGGVVQRLLAYALYFSHPPRDEPTPVQYRVRPEDKHQPPRGDAKQKKNRHKTERVHQTVAHEGGIKELSFCLIRGLPFGLQYPISHYVRNYQPLKRGQKHGASFLSILRNAAPYYHRYLVAVKRIKTRRTIMRLSFYFFKLRPSSHPHQNPLKKLHQLTKRKSSLSGK